jgi:hypothetical protein
MKFSMSMICRAACLSLLVGSTASAQPAHNDVQCLLVSNLFAKNGKEPKSKTVGQAAAFFYLGRIDGQMSGDQLKAAVREQQKSVNATNAAAIMARCARRMELGAKSIQSATGQWVRQK